MSVFGPKRTWANALQRPLSGVKRTSAHLHRGLGTMRTFGRSAAIVSFITFALSSPGHAVCSPGNESCEPSQDDVRAKVEQLFNSAFLTPYSIVSLEKFKAIAIKPQVGKN